MKILDIIREDASPVVYAVGDSHAEGLSYTKGIKNYAHGGQPSTSNTNQSGSYNGHPTGIDNVPKGAPIVIAQGCNDSANSLRAYLDSKGKTPLVSPEKIAGNVANLVSAATGAGHKVVFVLFPNGDPKIKPYYGGEYTEKVRQAIKSAVGVPVIDMNGSALADGVHAVPTAYQATGAKVLSMIGKTDSPVAAQKTADDEDDSPFGFVKKTFNNIVGGLSGAPFVISVPDSIRSPDVADVQKGITALGYKLPRYGIDGIRGKETSGAIASFQKDNGIEPTGVPDQATVDKLNSILKSKPDVIKTLTKSTKDDVKSRAVDKKERAMAPIQYDGVTKGKVGNVLNMIAGVESRGYYDMMNGSKRYPEILEMTLNELLKFQSRYRGGSSSAAGRYQYVPDTLVDVGRKMGADFNKQKFDPAFQDKLAIFDMRLRCRLDDWLDNKISDKAFLNLLANVWAGLPNTITGNSTYLGVLDNKAGVSTNVALNNLNKIKSA